MTDQKLTDDGEPSTSFDAYVAETLGGARAAPKEMALLLTCIDYRYPRRILDAMQRISSPVPYDQFILAGAALGACRKSWQDVLVEHIEVALHLRHPIKRIVLLDHRDCGAYRDPKAIGVDDVDPLPADVLPSVETARHRAVMTRASHALRERLRSRIPELQIDAWLLTRDEDDRLF